MTQPTPSHEPQTAPCPVCGAGRWRVLFNRQGYDFVRCAGCGLERLDPIPDMETIKAHYEGRGEGGNYDLGLHEQRADQVNPDMFRLFARQLGRPAQGLNILDVGCFTGEFLDCGAQAGMETWGLELQPEAARIAAEKHGGRVLNTTLEDLEAFEPQSFDCVAALGLIEHLSDPEVLMRLVKRVLKPGGMLFIQTPNTGSILAKVMRSRWFCYAPVEHIHYFSHRNLGAYLRRHGLEAVWSRAHWKHLEVGFVFHQMQFFGSDLYKLVGGLEKVLPSAVMHARLPFYGGEMMLAARRPDAD